MANLQPMTLDDGTVIYIQAQENIAVPLVPTTDDKLDFMIDTPTENVDRDFHGTLKRLSSKEQGQALKNTVQAYTKQVIQSFRELALAEVTEVNLEFGINIGAGAGIPYIASGSTDCNIKISVKCEFPKDK
jgi:hypothetical protein